MADPDVDRAPEGVTDEVWAETHPSVKAAFRRLEKRVDELEQRVTSLAEKLLGNSSNSSKPPSSVRNLG